MGEIETFNLNEDPQQDYDDINDLEMGNLVEVLWLVIGSILMSSKPFTFESIVTLSNLDVEA